ncbi:MAG TPA: hypothetical protein VKX17_24405 [Planctomycetota bacterium]|nr:hypothetical protein [Planctomycetota bacterium]
MVVERDEAVRALVREEKATMALGPNDDSPDPKVNARKVRRFMKARVGFSAACKHAVRRMIEDRDADICRLVLGEFEDQMFAKMMNEMPNSPKVSKASVFKTLRRLQRS